MKIQKIIQIMVGIAIFLTGNATFALQANTNLLLNKISQDGKNIVVSIDIDNPSNQNISSVQSWLEFDANQMNCKGINTDDSKFDFVVPGESNIVGNIVKIGRSSLSGDVSGDKINVAKINCEILKEGGEIKFHDYKTDGGKVSVMVFENGFPINTLKGEPKSIKFKIPKIQNENNLSKKTGEEVNSDSKSIEKKINRPSGLKIDTKIGSAVLAWNKVKGAKQYYVYYGKISGNYLKRRLVPNNTIYELGGLETGVQYYFAITAMGEGNSESDYSNEEAVIIGKKATSTSPLYKKTRKTTQNNSKIKKIENKITASIIQDNFVNKRIENSNIKKNVQTGPAETAVLVLIISFAIGLFIYRKKMFSINNG